MPTDLLERLVVAATNAMATPCQVDHKNLLGLVAEISQICARAPEHRGVIKFEHLLLANALEFQFVRLVTKDRMAAIRFAQVVGVLLPLAHADLIDAMRSVRP